MKHASGSKKNLKKTQAYKIENNYMKNSANTIAKDSPLNLLKAHSIYHNDRQTEIY